MTKIHIRYVEMVIHNTTMGIIGLPLYLNLLAFLGSIILNNPIKKYLGMMVTKAINPSRNHLNSLIIVMLPPPYSLL